MPNVNNDRIRAAINETVHHIGFAHWLELQAQLAGAEMKKKVG